MAERSTLHQQQHAFAGHIRDPQNNPAPEGVEDRRMAIYRDLFFNNVEGFLSSGFPVLKQLYSEQDWERLARDFFIRHRCRSPLFLEIAQEFIDYLQNEHEPQPEDPPFLLELAHYEWVELALSIDDTALPTDVDAQGNLLEGRLQLSPLAWPLTYAYPVHRIGPDFRPQAPGEPVHLLVYRNPDDDIGFMELNPVMARLLQLIDEQPDASGRQLMQQIADEMEHPNPGAVIDSGLQALKELHEIGVILGTRQ
jgi:hypothetical protein